MPNDLTILQIKLMFASLSTSKSVENFPEPGALSKHLSEFIDVDKKDYTFKVKPTTVKKFATASIEMWHRSVHSFLISAYLTKSSPVWSSVSGYYSSHYSVRAFAHLLGHFQLFKLKRVAQLEINGSNYYCHILTKKGGEREHKLSWKFVKENSLFSTDPFFTINDDSMNSSDGAHRNKANYQDHIGQFPTFQPLDDTYLKKRITHISRIVLSGAPIPNTDNYPDIENVQLIAYHRLIRFRMLLDEVLGGSNRFWNVNRTPSWCNNYLDFQSNQPEYLTLYKGIIA